MQKLCSSKLLPDNLVGRNKKQSSEQLLEQKQKAKLQLIRKTKRLALSMFVVSIAIS